MRAVARERMRAAIKQLNFERDITAANLSRKRIYDVHFVIPDGPNSFMRNLAAELEAYAPHCIARPDQDHDRPGTAL